MRLSLPLLFHSIPHCPVSSTLQTEKSIEQQALKQLIHKKYTDLDSLQHQILANVVNDYFTHLAKEPDCHETGKDPEQFAQESLHCEALAIALFYLRAEVHAHLVRFSAISDIIDIICAGRGYAFF
jgi:hypothetical protein